jgi:hypothetical protein
MGKGSMRWLRLAKLTLLAYATACLLVLVPLVVLSRDILVVYAIYIAPGLWLIPRRPWFRWRFDAIGPWLSSLAAIVLWPLYLRY